MTDHRIASFVDEITGRPSLSRLMNAAVWRPFVWPVRSESDLDLDSQSWQAIRTYRRLRILLLQCLPRGVDVTALPKGVNLLAKTVTSDFSTPDSPINWVIVQGGADAMSIWDLRKLRDQCKEYGVAFWFNGWGEYRPGYLDNHAHLHMCVDHVEANTCKTCPTCNAEVMYWEDSNHSTWKCAHCSWTGDEPDDDDECPNCETHVKVGVEASGCLLDGQEHKEIPDILKKLLCDISAAPR